MEGLICTAHELDDDLPTVGALVIHKGESLCLEHFEQKVEADKQSEMRFQRRLRDIERGEL
jgi:hypothetical protein